MKFLMICQEQEIDDIGHLMILDTNQVYFKLDDSKCIFYNNYCLEYRTTSNIASAQTIINSKATTDIKNLFNSISSNTELIDIVYYIKPIFDVNITPEPPEEG